MQDNEQLWDKLKLTFEQSFAHMGLFNACHEGFNCNEWEGIGRGGG